MRFAIEEINNRTDLLPGVSLGYKIYDACRSMVRAVRVTLGLTNGNEVLSAPSKAPCARPAQVQAIIGEASSSPSMAIATVIGPFHMPMISHFATCACLSDKTKYPSFLRTIPSDYYQSRALAQLVRHFGWTWVGAVRTNGDYGNNGMATFTETAQQLGICLEYSVSFFRTDPPDKIQKIIDIIKASTSKVIVTFLSPADIDMLIHEMSHHNLTGYQWVGTEAWIFDPQTAAMDKHHILDGAIGLSIPKAHVSGMREFMLDVKPLSSSGDEVFTEFWEKLFSCKFKQSKSSTENQRECTGHEDLTGVQNSFTDMSPMPIFNNIYKGVYAVAHALHRILSCNKTCNNKVALDPYTILQHIKMIHFKTKEGDEVYFDENGDPAAKYEIINWQPTDNGIVDFVTVGFYDASLPADKQLNLQNKSLIWANNSQQAEELVCKRRGDPENPQLSKDGDILLGGIFSFHSSWKTRQDNYMHKPLPLQCTSLNFRGFQYAQAMLFAIEEINNSTDLLPGVSLGYKIYDVCGSIARGVRVTLALANGNEELSSPSKAHCTRPARVQAIMGETSSSPSMAIATVIGPFHIPMVSHFATCACLSDKTKYPSFLRTIPSDYYQSRALAQLVKHFGWTWVGAVRTNDDYGNNGMATFTETAQQLGICLEYSVSLFRTDPPDKIQKIIDIIKASTSKVIVAFLSHMDMDVLIHELSHHNLTGYQWVGSESWISDSQIAAMDKHHILDGAIGLSISKTHVSGMRDFMLDVKPLNSSGNELFTEFWETLFSCKFKHSKSSAENQRECTGHEDLTGVQNSFTDMSLMPIFNNVYKGVYAVAHTLHSMLSCNKTCNNKVQVDPYTTSQHIKRIHFKTKEGEEVYFNENGDPAAKYEIINWQPTENGIVDFVTVGLHDASLPADKQLNLQNKSLIWANNSQQRWPEKCWTLLQLLLLVSVSHAEELVCKRRGDPENPQLFKDGDIFLGAIFSFHSSWKIRQDNYMHKPLPLQCARGFQYAQAMRFAIEEINNKTDLLPGISLGYKIYDSCRSIAGGVRVALALANDYEVLPAPSEAPCTGPAQVQAIIGETSSSPSMAIATVIGPFHIPMISHFATCACLSDKTKYPSFLRTIPSDDYQSRALAQLVKHFEQIHQTKYKR
ncbi:hypothetical protein ABVT39_022911 [Epinephelus coioides]